MREILTLSLPQKTKQLIKKRAKNKGFDSVSGYIKYLLSLDEGLISEKELLNAVKEARKEYKQGKTIKAKSMADLL